MPYQRLDNINAATMVGFEQFQQARNGIMAAVFDRVRIGGSRRFTVEGTGWQDAHDYDPIVIPDSASAGGVYTVDAWLKTANAATTIRARIRNITDATTADETEPEDATTFTKQTLSWTPIVGKEYRLQFLKSDDIYPAYGFGELQRRDGTDGEVELAPPATASTLVTGEAFTGDGAETDFVLAHAPTVGSVAVYVNGVRVSSWTLSDDTITFDDAPLLDDEILVDYAY